MSRLSLLFLFIFSLLPFGLSNGFLPCMPYRKNYKIHYLCSSSSERELREEMDDQMARMHGEPSAFARTGFYDKLFKQQNRIQYLGDYSYYPSYGFNANLPQNGPYMYRYSNFFTAN